MKAIPSIAAIAILVAQVSVCQDFKVGLPVADFSLRDLDGRSVSYSALKGKVTAVVFISTQCPVSNAYDDRMNALFKEFSGRVNFIFINSNATEQAGEVRDHARRVGFVFPVYKDPQQYCRGPLRRRIHAGDVRHGCVRRHAVSRVY